MSQNITGQIMEARRLNSSVNGNPRFEIIFVTNQVAGWHTLTTSSDAACSYAVENYLPRPHLGKAAPVVTLGLTRAGRVSTITEV